MVDSFQERKFEERSIRVIMTHVEGSTTHWFSCCLVLRDQIMVTRYCGGLAQLGERLNGIQEVSGSIPLTSTNLTGLRGTNFEVRKDFDSSAKKLETHLDRIE